MGNHHYLIAHRVVPSFFFQGPQTFIDITIRSPGRLTTLWDTIGKKEFPTESESGFGIAVRSLHDHGINGVVITYPPTEQMAECIMAACVIERRWRWGFIPTTRPRYITLEYGFGETNQPRTVLCEWGEKGGHSNYGDGPRAEVEAFISSVRGLIGG
jgi:hypothetical protein